MKNELDIHVRFQKMLNTANKKKQFHQSYKTFGISLQNHLSVLDAERDLNKFTLSTKFKTILHPNPT